MALTFADTEADVIHNPVNDAMGNVEAFTRLLQEGTITTQTRG